MKEPKEQLELDFTPVNTYSFDNLLQSIDDYNEDPIIRHAMAVLEKSRTMKRQYEFINQPKDETC